MDIIGPDEVVSEFSERRTGRRLRFDPSRAAILVVDMLNEFLEPGGEMVLLEGRRVIEPINRLLTASREMGMRVVWLCDEHPIPDDKEFEKRVPHCIGGTWNAGIIDAMDVAPHELRIAKRRYSGFFGTDLDLRLREWGVAAGCGDRRRHQHLRAVDGARRLLPRLRRLRPRGLRQRDERSRAGFYALRHRHAFWGCRDE